MPLLEISQLKKSFIGPDGEKQSIIDVRYFTLLFLPLPDKTELMLQKQSDVSFLDACLGGACRSNARVVTRVIKTRILLIAPCIVVFKAEAT